MSELLDAFRAGDGVDLIRESVHMVKQELIEAEVTERIGAGRYERTPERVTAALVGAEVLGERVGGYVGMAMRRTSARVRREAQPPTIPATSFGRWSPRIALNVPLRELPHIAGLERWLGEKIVARIPGAGDARD